MNAIAALFNTDIVLDEEAFQKAVKELQKLKDRLDTLNTEIESMLSTLERGFNTPAGRKLVASCEQNLRQPMRDQAKVLEHISSTLMNVRQMYVSVFHEYETLNNAIKAYNPNA